MGLDNTAAIVDLRTAQVVNTINLPAGSGATGAAIVNDSIAYVANPNLNTVTRINLRSGDTASVRVGIFPQGLVFTRGRLFVLNGNLVNLASGRAQLDHGDRSGDQCQGLRDRQYSAARAGQRWICRCGQ